MQVRWFHDFVDSKGNNLISDWLLSLDDRARMRIQRLISNLEIERLPRRADMAQLLGDNVRDLLELRMDSGNVEYRLLACKWPQRNHHVILLLGAEERNDRFYPRSAPKTAQQRRRQALADPEGRLRAHEQV